METYTENLSINHNGIIIETLDEYQGPRVRATGPNGETAIAHLAYSGGENARIYPRIEFWFHHNQRWIEPYCDCRFHNVEEFETSEEIAARPCDTGCFTLTEQERAEFQSWYDHTHQAPTIEPPQPITVAAMHDAEPIFAIGGLNRGDGAEPVTRWPTYGTVCRKCGASESLGAMFTTISDGDICDDCS